jgi:hypothetical protein
MGCYKEKRGKKERRNNPFKTLNLMKMLNCNPKSSAKTK